MRVLIISGLIILCDQITKLMVKGIQLPSLGISITGMRYGASKEIFWNFFRLTYIENPGMAFGNKIDGDRNRGRSVAELAFSCSPAFR